MAGSEGKERVGVGFWDGKVLDEQRTVVTLGATPDVDPDELEHPLAYVFLLRELLGAGGSQQTTAGSQGFPLVPVGQWLVRKGQGPGVRGQGAGRRSQ